MKLSVCIIEEEIKSKKKDTQMPVSTSWNFLRVGVHLLVLAFFLVIVHELFSDNPWLLSSCCSARDPLHLAIAHSNGGDPVNRALSDGLGSLFGPLFDPIIDLVGRIFLLVSYCAVYVIKFLLWSWKVTLPIAAVILWCLFRYQL